MEKKKTLLIVEQASHDLKQSVNEGSDVIYLEGVFTEFKVRNRNGRIYEANDFIPKMNELMPKIEKRTLLGELDHPVNFDVSLKNVSHVVESLTYDQENDRVIGKIRLLNTDAGKQAQALVRDGIPLHISSRAAGQINPQTGKVTLEKLFTYDLVADPGFENAELKRVNEAYGFGNLDNVFIYECEMPKENETINKIENISNTMNNVNEQKTVNVADFQKYTEYIAGVIEGVKTSIDDLKKQMNVNESANAEPVHTEGTSLEEQVNTLSEQVQNLSKHNDYLAEQLQKNCDHNDYLAEKLEKTIDYTNYLSENLDNSIEYSKYLSEKLDENFQHNDYLAEQLQKNCDHNDYLAEKLEQTGNYTNYLAENLEKNFAHNDYLAEQLNNGFKYSDYLAEQMQEISDEHQAINESKNNETKENEQINENANVEIKNVKSNDEYKSSITEKLDAILNAQTASIKEDNFLNFLSEGRRNEYENLNPETQHMIVEAMNAASVKNEAQANIVWKSVYESKKGLDIVENMPAVYRERWDALSDKRKEEILNEAKFYNLKGTNEIEYFWSTRDLRDNTVVLERVENDNAKTWKVDESKTNDYISNIMSRTKKNMRGF